MRADRLLKMTMILQTRGRQTAQDLADELEVSERTIYRDVIALSSAGVPIYTEKGPGGGIQLIEEYRTSLTGLSADEVRALFMINIPAALGSLGVGAEAQNAWLKLSAALPEYLQQSQADVRQRMLIDQDWWQNRTDNASPFLRELYQAIWEDQVIRITVRYFFGYQAIHVVQPYSLVSRGQRWSLVCCIEGSLKVFWLTTIESLEITSRNFARPPEFDLAKFWREWSSQQDALGFDYQVQVLAKDEAARVLSRTRAAVLEKVEETNDPQWHHLRLRFDGHSRARRRLLDLGGAVKVLEPLALAKTIEDYARQTIDLYSDEHLMSIP